MADSTTHDGSSDARSTTNGKGRVSVIGLFFSLVFFAVASVGFTGDPWWLLNEVTKWVIAGVVAVVGVSLLVTALPGRNRKHPN